MTDIERKGRRYRIIEAPPPAADFVAMRAAEGWGSLPLANAEAGLAKSFFAVTLICDGETVGFGRIVGDGAVYFFLTDVIVAPAHQGLGLGALIVERLMARALASGGRVGNIGLMSAFGKEAFYARFGFVTRPDPRFGAGMTWVDAGAPSA